MAAGIVFCPFHRGGSWRPELLDLTAYSYPCCFSGSVVSDSATPWTVAHQAPLSTGFSRQEYWSGLPFTSSEDFPNMGLNQVSPALAGGTPSSLIRDFKKYVSLTVMMENQPHAKILHTHKNALVVKQLYANKNYYN